MRRHGEVIKLGQGIILFIEKFSNSSPRCELEIGICFVTRIKFVSSKPICEVDRGDKFITGFDAKQRT